MYTIHIDAWTRLHGEKIKVPLTYGQVRDFLPEGTWRDTFVAHMDEENWAYASEGLREWICQVLIHLRDGDHFERHDPPEREEFPPEAYRCHKTSSNFDGFEYPITIRGIRESLEGEDREEFIRQIYSASQFNLNSVLKAWAGILGEDDFGEKLCKTLIDDYKTSRG